MMPIPRDPLSSLPAATDNTIGNDGSNNALFSGGIDSVPRSSSSSSSLNLTAEPHPSWEMTRLPAEKRKLEKFHGRTLPNWEKSESIESDFHYSDEEKRHEKECRSSQLFTRQISYRQGRKDSSIKTRINNPTLIDTRDNSYNLRVVVEQPEVQGNYHRHHYSQLLPSQPVKKRSVKGGKQTTNELLSSSGYGVEDYCVSAPASIESNHRTLSDDKNTNLYLHKFSLIDNLQPMSQSSSPLVGSGTGKFSVTTDSTNNNNNIRSQSWSNIPSVSVFSARGDNGEPQSSISANDPAHSLSSTSLNTDTTNAGSPFAMSSFGHTPDSRFQQFTTTQQQPPPSIHHTPSLNKRQRVARACDSCRKKKIKCDGKRPACTNCINSRTVCVFTVTERKRAVPKNAKYVDGLEKRIKKLEGLVASIQPQLKDSTLLENALNGNLTPSRLSSSDLPSVGKPPPPTGFSQSPQSDDEEQGSIDEDSPLSSQTINTELNDRLGTLILLDSGSGAYFGSCSSLSIVSSRGLQWIDERTGNTEFSKRLADLYKTRPADFFVNQNMVVGRSDFTPLPPPGMTLLAASLVFDIISCNMPLFDIGRMKNLLMRVLKRAERGQEHSNISEYFITNAILAVGTRMLATVKKLSSSKLSSNSSNDNENNNTSSSENNNNSSSSNFKRNKTAPSPDYIPLDLPPELEQYSYDDLEKDSWKYFHNAANYFTNLCCLPPSLDSIQGMLIMATYLFGAFIPSLAMSMAFITAAVRMAHTLGLHRNPPSIKISPNGVSERRNTWWHVFIFDSMAALRTGRPPLINLEDVSTSLPDEEPEEQLPANNTEGLGLSNRKCLFRLRVELNMISSKVYSKLYSCKASKLSNSQLLNVIGELDRELLEWRDRVPFEFRPDCEIQVTERPMLLWVLYLHCGYYETMSLIHRMSVHHCSWNSRQRTGGNVSVRASRTVSPRVYASAALCVKAARSTILLSNIVDPRDTVLCWAIMPYPMGAFIILFANCIQNPQQSSAQYDLQLMEDFIKFMEPSLSVPAAQRFLNFLNELKSIADYVVSKNRQERPSSSSVDTRPVEKTSQQQQHSSMNEQQQQQQPMESTDYTTMAEKPTLPPQINNSNFSDAYLNFEVGNGSFNGNENHQQQSYMGISMPQLEGSHQFTWNQASSPSKNDLGATSYIRQPQLPLHLYGAAAGGATESMDSNQSPIDQEKLIMEQQMMNFEQPFLPQDMWQLPMMDWSLDEFNNVDGTPPSATTTQQY